MAFLVTDDMLSLIVVLISAFVVTRLFVGWFHSLPVIVLPGTRLPPCLPRLPIVGSLPFIDTTVGTMHKYFVKTAERLGSDVFALYFGKRYVVVLNSGESIREALGKKSTQFADRSAPVVEKIYVNNDRKGVINAEYNASFRRKHQLYLSILKQFGYGQRLMQDRIHVEVAELIRQVGTIGGRHFDPHDNIEFCVMNVIGSIVLGRRYPFGDPTQRQLKEFIDDWTRVHVPELNFWPLLRFVPQIRRRVLFWVTRMKNLLQLLNSEIDDVLSASSAVNPTNSFVGLFMEATRKGGEYSDLDRTELVFVVRDLFGAGTHTVSATLSFALVLLANHRDVQTRLQQEIDSVVAADRLPSLDDEPAMTYAQAVVLETMRRHTVVPKSLLRETLCSTRVGKEVCIPARSVTKLNQWAMKRIGPLSQNILAAYGLAAGAASHPVYVIANIYAAHMDPMVWPAPTIFNPERFLNDKGEVTNKDKIMPFSLGKRSCLGEMLARQEIFLFLTGLAQNFNILPPEGQDKIEYEEQAVITNEPTPFDIRLVPRARDNN